MATRAATASSEIHRLFATDSKGTRDGEAVIHVVVSSTGEGRSFDFAGDALSDGRLRLESGRSGRGSRLPVAGFVPTHLLRAAFCGAVAVAVAKAAWVDPGFHDLLSTDGQLGRGERVATLEVSRCTVGHDLASNAFGDELLGKTRKQELKSATLARSR